MPSVHKYQRPCTSLDQSFPEALRDTPRSVKVGSRIEISVNRRPRGPFRCGDHSFRFPPPTTPMALVSLLAFSTLFLQEAPHLTGDAQPAVDTQSKVPTILVEPQSALAEGVPQSAGTRTEVGAQEMLQREYRTLPQALKNVPPNHGARNRPWSGFPLRARLYRVPKRPAGGWHPPQQLHLSIGAQPILEHGGQHQLGSLGGRTRPAILRLRQRCARWRCPVLHPFAVW